MEKKFTKFELARIKRTAQNVDQYVTKKNKLLKKVEDMQKEVDMLQNLIDMQIDAEIVDEEILEKYGADTARLFIPMDELIDKDKELARLNKEKEKVQKDIDFLSKKLSNQGFIAKAPKQLIEAEQAKLDKANEKMAKLNQSIEGLMA